MDNPAIRLLQTPDDQLKAMKLNEYKTTYRFLVYCLADLDLDLVLDK